MKLTLLLTGATVLALCLSVNGDLFVKRLRAHQANRRVRARRSVAGRNANITKFHVDSRIATRYARVVVTIVVNNTSPSDASLISMTMRLPKTAFISNFSMEIEGEVYVGEVKEKAAARAQFQQAVYQGQSTGLVSTTTRDTQTFDVSVNVAASESVTFRLNYDELLERKLGIYTHVIYADLGQLVDDYLVEVLVSEPTGITFLNASVAAGGGKRGGDDDVHSISSRRSGTQAYVSFQPSKTLQEKLGDSVIKIVYDVTRQEPGGQLITRDGYFVHWFAPSDLPVIPKNVVFVFDRSGSMSGTPIRQAKEALANILDELGPDDMFNIITFAGDIRAWRRGEMHSTSEENVRQAKAFVARMEANGATAFYDAVVEGVSLLESLSDQPAGVTTASMLIVLTDGQPTAGLIQSTNRIVSAVTERVGGRFAIFCLGFGGSVDQSFLWNLAKRNKGTSRRIYQHSDAALQVEGFYEEVASPLLSEIVVNYQGCRVDKLTQDRFDHHFAGCEVLVAGRLLDRNCLGPNFSARVSGQSYTGGVIMDSESKKIERGFADDSYDMEKIWAYLTIQQMLERRKGGNKTQDSEILRMSLDYNFVTELTSMVVTQPGVDTSEGEGSDEAYGRRAPRLPLPQYAYGSQQYPYSGPRSPQYGQYAQQPALSSWLLSGPPQQAYQFSYWSSFQPYGLQLYRTPPVPAYQPFPYYTAVAAATTAPLVFATTGPANQSSTATSTTNATATTTTTATITTKLEPSTTTTSPETTSETTTLGTTEPETAKQASAECGSSIVVENETLISSPRHPDLYPSNTVCSWAITKQTSANDTFLELTFESMDLEVGDDDCSRDRVDVWLDSVTEHRRFCGYQHVNATLLRAVHAMKVMFHSDDRVQGRGFVAKLRVAS